MRKQILFCIGIILLWQPIASGDVRKEVPEPTASSGKCFSIYCEKVRGSNSQDLY